LIWLTALNAIGNKTMEKETTGLSRKVTFKEALPGLMGALFILICFFGIEFFPNSIIFQWLRWPVLYVAGAVVLSWGFIILIRNSNKS